MSEKFLNSRIIHKHDVESNWNKATNFIPKQGELIVYDKDSTYTYERFKIGDGVTNVNSLPFADDTKVDKVSGKGLSTNDYTTVEKNKLAGIADGATNVIVDSKLSTTSTNAVQNKAVATEINNLNTLVGDTSVSSQISNAVNTKADKSGWTVEKNITTDASGNLIATDFIQADLAQNDNTKANYVNGIIRQESLPPYFPYAEVKMPEITWDGNTEGRDAVSIDIDGDTYTWVKVSEQIFTAEDASGCTISFSAGDIYDGGNAFADSNGNVTVNEIEVICVTNTSAPVIIDVWGEDKSLTFASTGTYFLTAEGQYVNSISNDVITYASKKILPQDIIYQNTLDRLVYEKKDTWSKDELPYRDVIKTIRWDGNTSGLVSFTSIDGSSFYKVSDIVLTIKQVDGLDCIITDGYDYVVYGDNMTDFGTGIYDSNWRHPRFLSAKAGTYAVYTYRGNCDLVVPEDGTYFVIVNNEGITTTTSLEYRVGKVYKTETYVASSTIDSNKIFNVSVDDTQSITVSEYDYGDGTSTIPVTYKPLPAVTAADNGSSLKVIDGEWTKAVDVIDSELSSTSTNSVQNKAVSAAISDLNTLVGDTSVSSQIATAIAPKLDTADATWTQIYDSGAITSEVNSISGIDIAGYKSLMVAVKCVNTTNTTSTRAGAVIFNSDSQNYSFNNIFSNLLKNGTTTSGAMAKFKIVDGFIICESAMRAINADGILSDTEGEGFDLMAPVSGGLIKCTNTVTTMAISSAAQSADHYYGVGSRVVVWGCKI